MGSVGLRHYSSSQLFASPARQLGWNMLICFLIHFPAKFNLLEKIFDVRSEHVILWDMKGTWQGMEGCVRLGLAKAIDVSNFTCKKLSQILSFATIPPAVNHGGGDTPFMAAIETTFVQRKASMWAYEQGVSFLPMSYNKERLKENMEIFDWELSMDELKKMSTLAQSKIFKVEYLVSADGIFKSVEDLWDGEV
ncbi:hypothetical protein Scep_016232 [Stephania cephalantha]|uniref:Uncharacterized protein n=1 Tax=Stephania cephalantha TaxID=152367 RepID=A0AAP0IM78_9MAGN